MPDRRTLLKSAAIAAGATTFNSRTAFSQTGVESEVDGYGYAMPSFEKGTRLLFQGDSITDMKWGRNQRDRNHYLGHSYVYLIAARLGVDLPNADLDFLNRGHSGNTVGDLRKRWQSDAIDLKPDLLSVLIGVNDVGRTIRANKNHVPHDAWERDYRAILNQSRAANPDLKIVLLDPFVLPSSRFSENEYRQWRGETDKLGEIVSRLAGDFDAIHVRTQRLFDEATKIAKPEHLIWDGVHPLPQGHELIARNWIRHVAAA